MEYRPARDSRRSLPVETAEVTRALTFCRSASLLSKISAQSVLLSAQIALRRASRFRGAHDSEDRVLQEFASCARALEAALQALAPSFQPSSIANENCWPGDLYRSEELRRRAIRRKRECLALLSSSPRLSHPFEFKGA